MLMDQPALRESAASHLGQALEELASWERLCLATVSSTVSSVVDAVVSAGLPSLPPGFCCGLARLLCHSDRDLRGYAGYALENLDQDDLLGEDGVDEAAKAALAMYPWEMARRRGLLATFCDDPVAWLSELLAEANSEHNEDLTYYSQCCNVAFQLQQLDWQHHGDCRTLVDRMVDAIARSNPWLTSGLGAVLQQKTDLSPRVLDKLVSILERKGGDDVLIALLGRDVAAAAAALHALKFLRGQPPLPGFQTLKQVLEWFLHLAGNPI